MKTSKILVALMSAAMLLIAGNAFAAISGGCVDCHTMHNSQDGAAMVFNDGDANPMLLLAGSCGGCHADATAAAANGTIPQVNVSTMAAAGSGGSFYWVEGASADASMAHNVVDLASPDTAFNAATSLPPGYSNTTTAGVNQDAATWAVGTQMTCAGVNGCHGDPTAADPAGDNEFNSVKGAHHANAGNDGATVLGATTVVGDGFRFLQGIAGIETTGLGTVVPTMANHNVYAGSLDGAVATGTSDTISALCARCHGNFHTRSEIGGTSSPWLRHPTDIDMKDLAITSEYAAYDFNLEAPVAVTVASLATVKSNSDALAYDNTEEIVTCLSCHYAHGSNNADLLRWDYNSATSTMDAGMGYTDGCFQCHTTK